MIELTVQFFVWGVLLALRGAATLKARALKEVWNIAAVIPVDKGGGDGSNGNSNGGFSGELVSEDNFLGICSRELLARGCELLKRTRRGKFITFKLLTEMLSCVIVILRIVISGFYGEFVCFKSRV